MFPRLEKRLSFLSVWYRCTARTPHTFSSRGKRGCDVFKPSKVETEASQEHVSLLLLGEQRYKARYACILRDLAGTASTDKPRRAS
jgi:hypothetical protein